MPKPLSDDDISAFRDRLCDAAELLFAEHGPDGVTMRQLADALGVSSMTPYRYFRDKDAILAAVRARAFTRFAMAMEAARESFLSGDRRHGALGEAYVAFALANPAAYKMMFDVYQPTADDYPDLARAMSRAKATMANTTLNMDGVESFAGGPELAAHMFWALMHGAVMLELANLLRGASAGIDARTIARTATQVMARGFSVKAPAKPTAS